MSDKLPVSDRRSFLKVAGLFAASAASGCTVETHPPDTPAASAPSDRVTGFDRTLLAAVGEVVLPSELGSRRRDAVIGQFVEWIDQYEPVAEAMHGYGYADIRYLPPDPAPAWRAQLDALDVLAKKTHRQPFARLTVMQRHELLTVVLSGIKSAELPAPLEAPHIAVALLAHWSSSPSAWDLALGKQVQQGTCRALGDASREPLPIVGLQS
jgi:hypothetical protein